MDKDNPKISIKESKKVDQKPAFKLPPDPKEELKDALGFQTKTIIGIFAIALVTSLLMVGGLLLDAWHFNSAIYREYTQKTESVETTQKINQELLDQNIKNQEIIIEQQKQIQQILKK